MSRRSALKFEGELMAADADTVAVAEAVALGRIRSCRTCTPLADCRSVIDETASGVDDHRVMAADLGVSEHDVVVGQPPDPGDVRLQRVSVSCAVAQRGGRRNSRPAAVRPALTVRAAVAMAACRMSRRS